MQQRFSVKGFTYLQTNLPEEFIVDVGYHSQPGKTFRSGIWISTIENIVTDESRGTSGLLELDAAEELAIRLLYLVKEARGELDA